MKNLHVFPSDENMKFSVSFIEFIDKNFDRKNHDFIIANQRNEEQNRLLQNVTYLPYNFKAFWFLIKNSYRYDKLFIHSFSKNKYINLALFAQTIAKKKCYWCIWGGDLYRYNDRDGSFKSVLKNIINRYTIKNFHGIITQLKGDYELAQKWYGVKGKYYYSFMYPSNLYKNYDLNSIERKAGKIYIQVGNSACDTNEHIDIFEKLSKYKDENIEIVCPLSYSGNEEYIKQVIRVGYKIFGREKFTPLTDFIPFDQYLKLLAKIDIAIFNHERQRGLGNITTLIGLGKKVYVREEVTTWKFCIDHNLKVFSANENYDNLFEKMDDKVKQSNIKNMKIKFSTEKLIEDWKKIFNEDE